MAEREQRPLLWVAGEHRAGFRDHVLNAMARGTSLRKRELIARSAAGQVSGWSASTASARRGALRKAKSGGKVINVNYVGRQRQLPWAGLPPPHEQGVSPFDRSRTARARAAVHVGSGPHCLVAAVPKNS
jgi:hypothetical protein